MTENNKRLIKGIILFLILTGFYFLNIYNYLLFHSLIELFAIVIAFAFFSITWNSKKYIQNGFLLFIGISYFFIGIVDLLHTLSYQGLHIFEEYDYATQFWISGRAMESITILSGFAFLHFKKKPAPMKVMAVYAVITGLIIYSILVAKIFPRCYIEGKGLTDFKVVSEYIIIAILLLSLVFLYYFRATFTRYIFQLLVISLVFTIFSELAFTVYEDAYDIFNFSGHSLKFLSFFFVYTAIIESGIRQPFQTLFIEIKENEKELTELNAMKDKYFSILAHDLRSPMSGIYSLSMSLNENFENIDQKTLKNMLSHLETTSKRGLDLLNDLLEWGRIQMNLTSREPKNIQLNGKIRSVVEHFDYAIAGKKLNVNINIDRSTEVYADENMLRSILRNLLSNAIKFSFEGGRIEVNSSVQNEYVVVSISDQGTGISKDNLSKLFHITENKSKPGTKNEKGTGLGLILVKDFVELNEGSIWVESEINEGTTFYLSLPQTRML